MASEARELGIVWTPGFILLVQAMIGMIALSLVPVAASLDPGPPTRFIEAMDVALSIGIALGLLWRPARGLLRQAPEALAAVPWAALCLHLHPDGASCVALLGAGAVFRAYYSLTALSMIVSYSDGLILGADTTLVQLAVVAVIVVLSGAAMIYAVESNAPGSSIRTFGDALWWALATATTVGYGDVVPVTSAGRAIASLLMLFGIGSFGIFISDMAARIVRLSLLGVDRGPVLNREKVRILRQLARLEELDDGELEIILAKIRLIHAVSRGAMDESVLEALGGPEAAV